MGFIHIINMEINKIHLIDSLEGLKKLPDNIIDACITSPPYNKLGLQGGKDTIAKNSTWSDWSTHIEYSDYDDDMPEDEYHKWQIDILNEIQRVLKPGGSCFYNHKNRRFNKSEYSPMLWIQHCNLNLFQTIIWNRKADVNNSKHFFQPVYESVYWFTKDNKKSPKFFKKNLKDQKNIWEISPKANLPHPAPFPEELVEHCVLAVTEPGDLVLDPFMGLGTTAVVSKRMGRNFIGFDISEEYIRLSSDNIEQCKILKKSELI